MLKSNKGFTLVELILVITILAILAVVALPQFQDVIADTEMQAKHRVIQDVRSSINSDRAADEIDNMSNGRPTFGQYITVAQMEQSETGDECSGGTGCFGGLFVQPLESAHWSVDDKDSTTVRYKFTPGEGAAECYVYTQGTAESSGSFEATDTCT